MQLGSPQQPSSARGFTYIWVMLTVALMGAGLAVGSEIYATHAQRAREQALLDIGHAFRAAIASYQAIRIAGRQEYPGALEDLLQDPRMPGIQRHLRRIYVDPMTGKAEWGLIRRSGRIVGIHSLSDHKPLKQDNFDENDASFRQQATINQWIFTYPPDLLLHGVQTAHDTPDAINHAMY